MAITIFEIVLNFFSKITTRKKFFFYSKEDLGTLRTDGTSSKLRAMHTYMASEKKGALPSAIIHWFFSLAHTGSEDFEQP